MNFLLGVYCSTNIYNYLGKFDHDLTVLPHWKSWLIRGIIPIAGLISGHTVKYYSLPRHRGIFHGNKTSKLWGDHANLNNLMGSDVPEHGVYPVGNMIMIHWVWEHPIFRRPFC
jgi:hypothetical protein